ncbi:MAG: photosystem II oxygen evolving complex protein PsbP [Oscillatoriales cyanobacterium SM2_2_1]|nr:photosystem II oxygen evolving complex protein PsbP [Oscillatoriales cyanobacterium SM2_2_1]
MMKRSLAVMVVALLWVMSGFLTGCVSRAAGLAPYSDSRDGYRFLYPNGWQETRSKGNLDVLLHDIIEPSENVAVLLSQLVSVKNLSEIGDAAAVGDRILHRIIAPDLPDEAVKLLDTKQRDVGGRTYYFLEYRLRDRHAYAAMTTSRGNLYTLTISALESRWSRVSDLFYRVASSFTVE